MYAIYYLLLLSLSLSASANEASNNDREALPLCAGHEADVLSITGYSMQLLPGNDVLEVEVNFETKQRFTARWLTTVNTGEGLSITIFSFKDSDEFLTINEFFHSQGKGRSIFKAKWSLYENDPIFNRPNLELVIHRDNGLDVVVSVDFSEGEGGATLTKEQLLTNQRFEFDQAFTIKQLPPAEYSNGTNDCKMEIILFSSPLQENSGEMFQLKSLRDYPPWLIPSARDMSFHHAVTPEADEDKMKIVFIFVPDSRPGSASYEPMGYAVMGAVNRESPQAPMTVIMTVRKSPVATEVSEVKTEIKEGSDLVKSLFFGGESSPTLDFQGSTPGQLGCVREYSGPGPRTVKVYIEVAGRSYVPLAFSAHLVHADLRRPAARVIQASSGGVLELSYFPLRNPAWVLAHKTRCRCVHRLAGGRVLKSPWREVQLF